MSSTASAGNGCKDKFRVGVQRVVGDNSWSGELARAASTIGAKARTASR